MQAMEIQTVSFSISVT